MNELIFTGHTLLVCICVLVAARVGKEALITLSTALWLIANLFVTKQIDLFSLSVTTSDAFVIGASLATALITERFGKKVAQKSVWIGFGVLIVFALFSLIHLSYMPNADDHMHPHFDLILAHMPRIMLASLCAYLLSQLLDVLFAAWLKKKFHGRHWGLRTFAVVLTVQAFDTVLFGFLGLYGIVASLSSILLVSFLMKGIALLVTSPIVSLLAPLTRRESV